MSNVEVVNLTNQLSIRAKNGIGFLMSAVIVWVIIAVIFLLPIEIYTKNVLMLFSAGIMFPLALLFSKLIKADWRTNDHPLGMLGFYLNIAQLMYFPIIFWALGQSPNQMVLFFAIITAAHLYPYGWFYHTKAYYFMAPVMSISLMFIGWNADAGNLWQIPIAMCIFLLILIAWLFVDFKKKVHLEKQSTIGLINTFRNDL